MAIADEQDQCVRLHGISWKQYEGILEILGDRRLPHSYRKGTLEIMSPSSKHEWLSLRLHSVIEAVASGASTPLLGFGSTTWRRESIDVGLEPDQCYYIAHELQMRKTIDIDFEVDPAPDLVVEIDVTRSSKSRLVIYAELGVTEVWRHAGQSVTFLELTSDRKYQPREHSIAFPHLRPADVLQFLDRHGDKDDDSWRQDIAAWSRQNRKQY